MNDDRERQGPDAEHFRRYYEALEQMSQSTVPAAYPTADAGRDPTEPQNCYLCRWNPDGDTCDWAKHNPMPADLPFWMVRAAVAYVDSDEGQDCGAFEPRRPAGGGR